MNITVTDQEHCKKQVKLEIPSDEVKKEIDKVAGQLSRRVTVAGFRPGHVPKSVIMTRFKKELRDEVASKMIPDAFDSAMHEKNLKVVGEPELEEFK
ncbi:MAG: trigger factor, partial [Blastocatellia bacterium]